MPWNPVTHNILYREAKTDVERQHVFLAREHALVLLEMANKLLKYLNGNGGDLGTINSVKQHADAAYYELHCALAARRTRTELTKKGKLKCRPNAKNSATRRND
jgi:hypothetical protein